MLIDLKSTSVLSFSFFDALWNTRSHFPTHMGDDGASKREVPIPMVALVATAVSAIHLYTPILTSIIALCRHSWMAFGKASPDGILNKFLPWCLSRPHRYFPPYSRESPWRISSHDVRYICSGKVRLKLTDLLSLLICNFSAADGTMAVPIADINLGEMEEWRIAIALVSTDPSSFKPYCTLSTYSCIADSLILLSSTIGLYTSFWVFLFVARCIVSLYVTWC